jgi:hypothetical protein
MKTKYPIPYKRGSRVRHLGFKTVGIVEHIREHLPVMLRVQWQDGSGVEWIPIQFVEPANDAPPSPVRSSQPASVAAHLGSLPARRHLTGKTASP